MANNITISDKNTGDSHTAAEYNAVKTWLNEPSQSLGTFNPAMTFDGQGTYDDYTLTGNITITAIGIKNSNERFVSITGSGTNTVSIGSGCRLVGGTVGTLQSGEHLFYMKSFAGEVHIIVKNASQSQLSPPTNLQASAENEQISLTWSAVQGATGYTLESSTDQQNWINATTLTYDGTSTNYTFTGLTNGTQYYFRVKATAIGYSDSSYSQTSSTPSGGITQLTAISDLAATAGNGQVTLAFTNPNSGNEDDNLVQYSTDNFSSSIVSGTVLASGATGGTQSGLSNGTLYYFRIISRGSGSYSNSNPSNVDSATPATGSIIVMQDNFTGTTIDSGKWTKTDPADGVTITQNDELIFTLDRSSPVASTNTNRVESVSSITNGCFQFTIGGTANAVDGTFSAGLSESHGTDALAQVLAINGGSPGDTAARLRFWDSGVTYDTDFGSGTDELFSTWRIRYNSSVTTVYIDELTAPDTWTNRASRVFNLGTNLTARIGASSISGTGTMTYTVNDVYFTNDTYSTSAPA